ncbi:putative small GTP-binding rab protein [Trypanosoma grayi]|uniref:putative small GTP-binding rab protein n=1 Tax=Trypanosoma grayi TaxID=71804 RepID=UPI0004F472B5|nr:putative small GTP-binding rab protein [Trypanosoma grayi]KEG10659.1 putative small GTP-binding rab protein [Trypanosoma grayi]
MLSDRVLTSDLVSATETFDSSSSTDGEDEREYVFKVVVVGEYSVGKTLLVKRLLTAPYSVEANGTPINSIEKPDVPAATPAADGLDVSLPVVPTVGTDFFSRVVRNVRDGQHVRLQFWDTAGLERYAAVHASTYRNASAVVVVFDVSSRRSVESVLTRHLEAAARYNPDIDQQSIFIVANKVDLRASGEGECVSQLDIESTLLSTLPDVHYHEVSALTTAGVCELLRSLCDSLLTGSGADAEGATESAAPEQPKPGADATKSVDPSHNAQPTPAAVATTTIDAGVGEKSVFSSTPPVFRTDVPADDYSPREGDGGNTTQGVPVAERHADPHQLERRSSDVLHSAAATATWRGGGKTDAALTMPESSDAHEGNCRDALEHSCTGADEQRRASTSHSSDSVDFQQRIQERFNAAEQNARQTSAPQPLPPNAPGRDRKVPKVKLSSCSGEKSTVKKSKRCKC